ncbi:MAG TPA: plastocyanin/azurin family copper-binding protein [Baekduia sp.]|nr:plastocyanin/azurin family copper-binding protein [Baekduia sp.]
MRSVRSLLATSAVALLASGVCAQATGAAKAKQSVVGLGLREYRISVYRASVPTGRVVFNLKNFGEDRHDVQISGPGGYLSPKSREVTPFGGTDKLKVRLRRSGTYTLICTLPAHADLGMKAKIKVKKRKANSAS